MLPLVVVSVAVAIMPVAVVEVIGSLACGEGRREFCDGEGEREHERERGCTDKSHGRSLLVAASPSRLTQKHIKASNGPH
jgi:hypothetical protein